VRPQHWALRPRLYKALVWMAYGVVRLGMGLLGYGGNEWFRGRRRRHREWHPPQAADDGSAPGERR
jgi:hypothetical protein